MSTTICGHKLTQRDTEALNAVHDYMRRNAGDSHWSNSTSPKGDGRAVPLTEIFSGCGYDVAAKRRTIARLDKLGILRACEIELADGMLKGVPSL